MPKVEFNMDNVKKCQCSGCPVQAQSECVALKLRRIKEMPAVALKEEDVPGVYCSKGQADCKDLSPEKPCVCPTCAVWTENKLQSQYYCQRGNADKNG